MNWGAFVTRLSQQIATHSTRLKLEIFCILWVFHLFLLGLFGCQSRGFLLLCVRVYLLIMCHQLIQIYSSLTSRYIVRRAHIEYPEGKVSCGPEKLLSVLTQGTSGLCGMCPLCYGTDCDRERLAQPWLCAKYFWLPTAPRSTSSCR
jgi:hypothetical protein